ncbi:hypothetical protein [Enterobacter hormaechei]|uniref:hypothetical protein n=1 Tax=Enterobacter hormaechei TaxID=158836 RepID=UPI003CC74C8F
MRECASFIFLTCKALLNNRSIFRKVFSAHFGQLAIIFIWLSGMYFHGARFSNYEAWLGDLQSG